MEKTLLSHIQATGISLEQSIQVLFIVGEAAKRKYPILEGTINSFLKEEFKQVESDVVEKILNRERTIINLI